MSAPLILTLALTAAGPRIAVLDLKARVGVSAEFAQAVTDDVVSEVRKLLPKAKVISADEIRSTVKYDLQKRDLGCDVTSCLSEIGGALGVELLVTGTLSKFGKTYLLSLKTIDPRLATVAHEYTQKIAGDSDEALLAAVAPGVRQLFPELVLPPEPVTPAPLILAPLEPAPEPQLKTQATVQPQAEAPARYRTNLLAEPTADVQSAPPPRPASSSDWMPVVGWTGVGLSIGALAAGGILLGIASNEYSVANADTSAGGLYHKTQTADRENAAGIGALIGGGVLLIPAIILLMIHPDPPPASN